jgi:hypothetical protein
VGDSRPVAISPVTDIERPRRNHKVAEFLSGMGVGSQKSGGMIGPHVQRQMDPLIGSDASRLSYRRPVHQDHGNFGKRRPRSGFRNADFHVQVRNELVTDPFNPFRTALQSPLNRHMGNLCLVQTPKGSSFREREIPCNMQEKHPKKFTRRGKLSGTDKCLCLSCLLFPPKRQQ